MEYRKLGRSDLNISRIGFGCMSLKPGQEDVNTLIGQAIARGINYFDTSDLYDKGENEVMLGKALAGKRQQVIVATKVGNQWRQDGSGWDWNPTKKYILQAVEESLARLQTDYIDLYQLHGGTIDDPIDETIGAFEQLQKQGKIRYYGISSIRPNVIREYVNRSNIVSVMMQYSLLDRRPEESCMPLLSEHNIGVLARGSVASGLLVNKPPKQYLEHNIEQVSLAVETIKQLAANEKAAQVAIGYVLNNPAVSGAVVGIRTPEQLNDAIEASSKSLSPGIYDQLSTAVPAHRYKEHR